MFMIRTIQTISILAILLAALLFISCLADGLRDDSCTEQVGTPSAIERFQQAGGNGASDSRNQVSPLVQQAQAFALYLNPPAVAAPIIHKDQAFPPPAKDDSSVKRVMEVRPASSSPNFELHGISYYRSKPHESMALVCEPGGNRRWVRQGEQLGHLVIERIDGDSIVYREGAQTHVMALAPKEALAKLARASSSVPAPKQTDKPARTTPAPPPVRGIRQMPLARVAAKVSVPLSEIPLPNSGNSESQ